MILKKGCIYNPNKNDRYGFMTPHAMLFDDVIRLWGGVRDSNGISHIEYIDVDAENPLDIINQGKTVLASGRDGCFDDNGVILGDVILINDSLYMYYVGFQHVAKVKFYAFSGLAISHDGGETFFRDRETPIMDRTTTGRFGRCIHTVLPDNGKYKIYYAIINDWMVINHISYPVYDIWYTESEDGKFIPMKDDCICITTNDNEYRIGRPKVYKTTYGYEMFYTRDFISKDYVIGYARSKDGINWHRDDDNPDVLLRKSVNGWDGQMACYPVKLQYKDKTYIFYNGNDMGMSGVGYAEIVE